MSRIKGFVSYRGRIKAFSLVELLVVISVIGIISTFTVMSFNQSRVKARDNKRISDANLIASALGQYYTGSLRSYPLPGPAGTGSTSTNFAAVDTNTGWLNTALKSYISPLPSDTGANAYYYVYRQDGKRAAVVVLGLEGGISKCNISSAATATATVSASATASATSSLPDAVADFVVAHPTACYYVSL